eukprot:1783038-Rhodomonas_salina.1
MLWIVLPWLALGPVASLSVTAAGSLQRSSLLSLRTLSFKLALQALPTLGSSTGWVEWVLGNEYLCSSPLSASSKLQACSAARPASISTLTAYATQSAYHFAVATP